MINEVSEFRFWRVRTCSDVRGRVATGTGTGIRRVETFLIDCALGDVDGTMVVVCFEVLDGPPETRA